MKKTAKVNKPVAGLPSNVILVELSEAITYRTQQFKVIDGVWHYEHRNTRFIAISLGKHYKTRRPETRVFAANDQGEILSWFSIIPAIECHAEPQRVLTELGFRLSVDVATELLPKRTKQYSTNMTLLPMGSRQVSSTAYEKKSV